MNKNLNKKSLFLALEMLSKIDCEEEIVFLCLGSQKVVFDSLAVYVADQLKQKFNISTYVYGGTNCNITRQNIFSYVEMINSYHPRSKIVVIDCALGEEYNIGIIRVNANGVLAGSAFDSEAKLVGDYSIIGIIGEKNTIVKNLLLTDRNFISQMSQVIAKGISEFMLLRQYIQSTINSCVNDKKLN